jgi:hypothetical protein
MMEDDHVNQKEEEQLHQQSLANQVTAKSATTISKELSDAQKTASTAIIHHVFATLDVFCYIAKHLNRYELDILQRVDRAFCHAVRTYKAEVTSDSSPFYTLKHGDPDARSICVQIIHTDRIQLFRHVPQKRVIAPVPAVLAATSASTNMDVTDMRVQKLITRTNNLITQSRIDFENNARQGNFIDIDANDNDDQIVEHEKKLNTLSSSTTTTATSTNGQSFKKRKPDHEFYSTGCFGDDEVKDDDDDNDDDTSKIVTTYHTTRTNNPTTAGVAYIVSGEATQFIVTFSNQFIIRYHTNVQAQQACINGRASQYDFNLKQMLFLEHNSRRRSRGMPSVVGEIKCSWSHTQIGGSYHRDSIDFMNSNTCDLKIQRLCFLHSLLDEQCFPSLSSHSSSFSSSSPTSSSPNFTSCLPMTFSDGLTSSISSSSSSTLSSSSSMLWSSVWSSSSSATVDEHFIKLEQYNMYKGIAAQDMQYPAVISKTQIMYAVYNRLHRLGNLPAVISMNEMPDGFSTHNWKLTLEFYNCGVLERRQHDVYPVRIVKSHKFRPRLLQLKKQRNDSDDEYDVECLFTLDWSQDAALLLTENLGIKFNVEDITKNDDMSGDHWFMKNTDAVVYRKTFSLQQVRELSRHECFEDEIYLRALSQHATTSAELIGRMIVSKVTSACMPAFGNDSTKQSLINNPSAICFGVIPLSNHFFDVQDDHRHSNTNQTQKQTRQHMMSSEGDFTPSSLLYSPICDDINKLIDVAKITDINNDVVIDVDAYESDKHDDDDDNNDAMMSDDNDNNNAYNRYRELCNLYRRTNIPTIPMASTGIYDDYRDHHESHASSVDNETLRSSNHDVLTFCIIPRTVNTTGCCDNITELCMRPFIEWRIHSSLLQTTEAILQSPTYQHKSFRPDAEQATLFAYIYRDVFYGNPKDTLQINPDQEKAFDAITDPYEDVERELAKRPRSGSFRGLGFM